MTDGPTEAVRLPRDWYSYIVLEGADIRRPGIYEWHIEGVGSYIGMYGRIRRPTKEYGRNVVRLLNRRPYRLNAPGGFRQTHRHLEMAHRQGRKITLTILENVDDLAERRRRERELIAERGALNEAPLGLPPR